MSLAGRLIACAVAIGLAAASSSLLTAHLAAGSEGVFVPLRAALETFPIDLALPDGTACKGQEHPGRPDLMKQVPFADEVVYRYYTSASPGGVFLMYAAHSRTGEDRKHHPEVCLREAAGTPEDISARLLVPLRDDGKAFAQRFRFQTGITGTMNLYYWHYTLPHDRAGGRSALQSLHARLIASAPSITCQASSYATGEDLERFERETLPAIDAAFRAGPLPDGTAVGCDRIPITFLRR